uniref:Uncharacterized protein n=1 Tax=Ophiognomonia clavigignenti-juglandacearum TaxID=218668 RepID=A0A2C9DSD6_9PEZI|nr:hypothetical protein [Ophiognomonia clavigignenti-juglandacearum]
MPSIHLPGIDYQPAVETAGYLFIFLLGKKLWDNRPQVSKDLSPGTIRLSNGDTRRGVAYLGDNPLANFLFLALFSANPNLSFAMNTCPRDGLHYPVFYANNNNTFPALVSTPISLPFVNDEGIMDYHISTLFPSPKWLNWMLILAIFKLNLTTGYNEY